MHSYLASPKATIAVLQEHGLYTKKKLGQHFLVDDNVIGHILALAQVSHDDVVVEVGPGIGVMTAALVETPAHVVAVEFDADLLPVLERTVRVTRDGDMRTNFALVQGDATTLSPAVISEPFGAPTALVSNLPYQVAATIVLRYFEIFPSLRQATVMVQSEVAARMAATPGSKTYGAYTAKLNMLARAQESFPVSRQSFLPPPRVDSTVIRLNRVSHGLEREEYAAVARVIDGAFAQRRKTLRNNLKSALKLSDEAIEAACQTAGVEPSTRAETLDVAAFRALAKALEARK